MNIHHHLLISDSLNNICMRSVTKLHVLMCYNYVNVCLTMFVEFVCMCVLCIPTVCADVGGEIEGGSTEEHSTAAGEPVPTETTDSVGD